MSAEKIIKITRQVLEKMAISFESVEEAESGLPNCLKIVIKTRESGRLIGKGGEHWSALNFIVKKMVERSVDEGVLSERRFFVDINDYYEAALRELKTKAVIMAERAKSFKTAVELEPMPPFERMVVHTALEGAGDVITESKGAGKNRRVVIKYVEKDRV
ncbi:MAG: hypothetical protein HYT43_01630 [Candidatus Taylorbacteria bacterium]|nr:hypothetical protein [Candidatus Taylorbacteria bacterium]